MPATPASTPISDGAGPAAGGRPGSPAVTPTPAFVGRYAHGEERPLGGYAVLLSVYGSLVTLGAALVRRRRRALPERMAPSDLALIAVATHMGTRLVAKDSVTAAVRAPFTRYEEPAGEGEVNESVPGTGLRHAVGELVTCPFCLAVWVATAFTFGLLLAPRATRWIAGALCAVTGSDYLQFAYAAARQRV